MDEIPNVQSFSREKILFLIDPGQSAGPDVPIPAAALVASSCEAGAEHLPSDGRLHQRAAPRRNGIPIPEADHRDMLTLASQSVGQL